MKIGIIGLGLIGGSLGRTIVKKREDEVYAFDISNKAMLDGKLLSAYHHQLGEENVSEMDMVIFCLYPNALEDALNKYCPLLKDGCIVLDCSGNKRRIVNQMQRLSKKFDNLNFISAHPMAGREFSGVTHSTINLFEKASMILVPVCQSIQVLSFVKEFTLSLGFGSVVITNAKEHDKIIAYTSQLAHIVSSSYIKSPTASQFMGFSAGSFRDMTRVARLSPEMWAQLTLDNADFLVEEIDNIIDNLSQYKLTLQQGDKEKMKQLLEEGNQKKLSCEKIRRTTQNENV